MHGLPSLVQVCRSLRVSPHTSAQSASSTSVGVDGSGARSENPVDSRKYSRRLAFPGQRAPTVRAVRRPNLTLGSARRKDHEHQRQGGHVSTCSFPRCPQRAARRANKPSRSCLREVRRSGQKCRSRGAYALRCQPRGPTPRGPASRSRAVAGNFPPQRDPVLARHARVTPSTGAPSNPNGPH